MQVVMKRWSKHSWRSDETRLISAILDAAKKSEASLDVAEDESSDRAASEESSLVAQELHSSRTGAG